jgi:aerobic carbon-monoxide dehydrogenase large subunit
VSVHDSNGADDPTRSSRIGESVLRIEDDRLLRGRGSFIDDLDIGRVVHVAFLRSQHAHASFKIADVAAARAMPSVIAVLTAKDLPHIKPICADFQRPGFVVAERPVLASDRVRFVGDLIAMVIAENSYAALDALEAVEIEFEQLACITESRTAIRPDAPQLYDHVANNTIYEGAFESPDFALQHAAAPLRLKETFSAARVAAIPIEPRGCIASFQKGSGSLILWTSTQSPHLVRAVLAEYLGLRKMDVRVVAPDVGGGFGTKTVVYPEEILVSAASMKLGVPVKWVEDRYENMLASAQARDHTYEVEVGFDSEGVVSSLSADILVNIGAYPSLPMGSSLEANGASRNMPGPYTLKHFRYRTRAVATNKCPTGPYRGVSAPLACLAVEGLLDRIARQLDLDPAEVRRRNLVREFPFKNVLGQDYSEGCFAAELERALIERGNAKTGTKMFAMASALPSSPSRPAWARHVTRRAGFYGFRASKVHTSRSSRMAQSSLRSVRRPSDRATPRRSRRSFPTSSVRQSGTYVSSRAIPPKRRKAQARSRVAELPSPAMQYSARPSKCAIRWHVSLQTYSSAMPATSASRMEARMLWGSKICR